MSDLIGALGALKGFLDESQARKMRIAGDETIDNYFFSDLDMDNSGVLDASEVEFAFDVFRDYADNGVMDEEHIIANKTNEKYCVRTASSNPPTGSYISWDQLSNGYFGIPFNKNIDEIEDIDSLHILKILNGDREAIYENYLTEAKKLEDGSYSVTYNNETYVFDERGIVLFKTTGNETQYSIYGLYEKYGDKSIELLNLYFDENGEHLDFITEDTIEEKITETEAKVETKAPTSEKEPVQTPAGAGANPAAVEEKTTGEKQDQKNNYVINSLNPPTGSYISWEQLSNGYFGIPFNENIDEIEDIDSLHILKILNGDREAIYENYLTEAKKLEDGSYSVTYNNETYVFDERGIVLSKTVGDRTTYTTEGIRALGDPNDLNDTYDKIANYISNDTQENLFIEYDLEKNVWTIKDNSDNLNKKIGFKEDGTPIILFENGKWNTKKLEEHPEFLGEASDWNDEDFADSQNTLRILQNNEAIKELNGIDLEHANYYVLEDSNDEITIIIKNGEEVTSVRIQKDKNGNQKKYWNGAEWIDIDTKNNYVINSLEPPTGDYITWDDLSRGYFGIPFNENIDEIDDIDSLHILKILNGDREAIYENYLTEAKKLEDGSYSVTYNNETYVFDERGIVLSKTVGDRTTYTTEGIRALGDPNDLNDTYDKIATNIENEITNGSADYFVEFNENKEPKEATIYKNGKLYKRIGYDENGNATLLEDKYGLTLEGVGIINNPNVTDDKYDAICNTFGLDPNTQGGQIRLVKPNTEDNNAYNNVWQIGALDGNGEIATRYQLPSNTSTEFNPDNISDDIKPENLLEDEHGLTALGLKVDLGQSKIYDIITYGTDEQKAVLAKKLGINVDDLDNLRIEPLKNNKNDEASKDAKDVQETKNEKEIISYIVVGSNVEFSFPTEKGFETNTIQIGDVVYDLGDIYENTDNKTFEFRKLRDDNGYTAAGAVKKDPKMAQILDKTNENVKFSLTSNQEDGTIISWKVNEGEIKINGKDYTYTLPEGATLSQNSDNDSSTHLDEYEIEVTGVIDDQGNDATIVLGFGAGDDTLYYIENINLEHIDLIYPDNQSSDLSRERHWNCSAGSYDLDNLFANKEIPWNVKMKLVDYNDMENLLGINYVNSIGSGQSCPQSWYTDQLNIMISNDPISVEEIIQFTKTYSNMAGTNSTIIYALTYSQENCINLINALSNNATAEELKEFNKIVPFEKLFTYYNRDNLAGIEISEAFIKLFSRNDFYEKNSTNEAGIWNIAKTTCECGDINNRPKLQYVLEAYEKGLYKGKYTDEEIRQYIINLYSRENPSNDKIYDPENLIDDLDKMYTVVWPFNIPKNYHQTFLKIMNPFN